MRFRFAQRVHLRELLSPSLPLSGLRSTLPCRRFGGDGCLRGDAIYSLLGISKSLRKESRGRGLINYEVSLGSELGHRSRPRDRPAELSDWEKPFTHTYARGNRVSHLLCWNVSIAVGISFCRPVDPRSYMWRGKKNGESNVGSVLPGRCNHAQLA